MTKFIQEGPKGPKKLPWWLTSAVFTVFVVWALSFWKQPVVPGKTLPPSPNVANCVSFENEPQRAPFNSLSGFSPVGRSVESAQKIYIDEHEGESELSASCVSWTSEAAMFVSQGLNDSIGIDVAPFTPSADDITIIGVKPFISPEDDIIGVEPFIPSEDHTFVPAEKPTLLATTQSGKKSPKLFIGVGGSLQLKDSFEITLTDSIPRPTSAIKNLRKQLKALDKVSLKAETSKELMVFQKNIFEKLLDVVYKRLPKANLQGFTKFGLTPIGRYVDERDGQLPEAEKSSGLVGFLQGGQGASVNITRGEFRLLFNQAPQLSSLTSSQTHEEVGSNMQELVDKYQTSRENIQSQSQEIQSLANVQASLKATIKAFEDSGFLDGEAFKKNGETKTKRKASLTGFPNLQAYSGTFFGFQGAASASFPTMDLFIGVGKTGFYSIGESNFGLLLGVDAGVTFSPRDNSRFHYRYDGVAFKVFMGPGFHF